MNKRPASHRLRHAPNDSRNEAAARSGRKSGKRSKTSLPQNSSRLLSPHPLRFQTSLIVAASSSSSFQFPHHRFPFHSTRSSPLARRKGEKEEGSAKEEKGNLGCFPFREILGSRRPPRIPAPVAELPRPPLPPVARRDRPHSRANRGDAAWFGLGALCRPQPR